MTGTMRGRTLHIHIWSAMVPASMEITIEAHALRGLTIATRGTLDSTVHTGDPLLDQFLDISTDNPALTGLLGGLHEALMEIFHAHPTAQLHDGRLTMQSGEASTLEAAPFLTGAAELLDQLEARLATGKQTGRVPEVIRTR
ncbi:MAG: hypothetical protein ACI8S6_002582 [Myxococcota bacterium]